MGYIRTTFLLLLLASAPLRAGETTVDVVMVVDVSREMEPSGQFDRARELLSDLVDRVAVPGAQVAVVPFGDGVHEPEIVHVGHGETDVAEARARLRRALEGLRAQEPRRYLHAAVARGVRQLRSFARQRPDHERRLVVVAGGARNVPADAPAKSLAARIAAAEENVIRPGRGWTVWYGYFGDADPDLLDFVAGSGAGTALKLDGIEALRWTSVHVETPYVSVGELPAGEWKRRVRLFVNGQAGVELAVRGDAGNGPASSTLKAAPDTTKLRRDRSTVAIDLAGRCADGARYEGAHIRLIGKGPGPVWITGSRIAVDVGSDSSRASFDASELSFERVDRGTRNDRILRITPNQSAREGAPELTFQVTEVPTDVDVTVEPKTLRLDKERVVTVRVAPRAGAVPGTYESRIVLQPGEGLRLDHKEIRVRYNVGHGSIQIVEKKLEFGDVVRGTDKVARLMLVPDQGAVEAGAQVVTKVEGLPDDVAVEVLEKFTLFGETALEIRARVSSLRDLGTVEGILRFEASGNVRVIPDSVPVTLSVVPPPSVHLGDTIDIGPVRQSMLDGYEFSFPVEIDPAHHGTVIELIPQESGSMLQPSQVRLVEGKQDLRFKLKSKVREVGPKSVRFAVFSLRDGARRAEGELRFEWSVEESYLRFVEWQNPEPLKRGETLVQGRLVLDASPDMRGREVELKTRFESKSRHMRIATVLDRFELTGGSQSIPVKIDVVAADPGKHAGFLDLGLVDTDGTKTVMKPVALRIEVPEPPPMFELLDPANREQLYAVAGVVGGLLLCLLWLLRRNRRVVHRMVRFTPPAHPNEVRGLVESRDMFAFEDDLRRR